MKKYLLSLLIVITSFSAFAQVDTIESPANIAKGKKGTDTLWRSSLAFGINFTNVGLNNWAGGGQNALSFVGVLVGSVGYHKNRLDWNNYLDLAYGFQRLGNKSAPFRKSDDRMYFQTKFAYEHSKKIRYTALAARVNWKVRQLIQLIL